MPAVARDDLEALLRHRKLDHTLTTAVAEDQGSRWLVPTGMAALDARLDGGFPRGQLSEIAGPRSSGRLAVAVALIDPLDMFDPVSASAHRIDFARMLWVRGEACGSARVSLSCEYGTLQKSLDRAVKALNMVLQAGGFGLVVLDLAEVASQAVKRLPYTTWLRLHRVIEGSDTACVLIGAEPIARSAGGVSVLLTPPAARGSKTEGDCSARVVRARARETERDVCLSLSAPAC